MNNINNKSIDDTVLIERKNSRKNFKSNITRISSRSLSPSKERDISQQTIDIKSKTIPSNNSESAEFFTAYCSWCYNKTMHGLIQYNLFRRNVYVCCSCSNRTLLCRICQEAMARGHGAYDDELCSLCDTSIQSWDDVVDKSKITGGINIEGYCSWCFYKTVHVLRMLNVLRRNTYICTACNGRTSLCVICQKNFARSYDLRCFECDATITNWERISENIDFVKELNFEVRTHFSSFESYAPVRNNQWAFPLVDGKAFFEAVAWAVEHAKESIFLSFWHMNDKIYLRRYDNEPLQDENRLDVLLLSAAQRGVKIYVLLWNERYTFLVDNFSYDMKKILHSLHPNIKVIRHCNPNATLSYVHHQKFVVFDQDYAIIGGFDICLGRYDTPKHVLTDVDTKCFPGVDYYNPHILRPSTINILSFFEDIIDRKTVPRMPWHDISIEVLGWSARDASANFVERWNHHNQVLSKGFEELSVKDISEFNSVLSLARLNSLANDKIISESPSLPKTVSPSVILKVNSLDQLRRMHRYEKYSSPLSKIQEESGLASLGIFFGCASASDLRRPLSPPPQLNLDLNDNSDVSCVKKIEEEQNFGSCRIQMIRSLSEWSGSWRTEKSLRYAYEKAIADSQHFIYIENQYFSSDLAGGGIQNHCASLILSRIRSKILAHEVFRVIIVLPQPEEQGSTAMNILKWQYRTINRGGYSIIEQLSKEFPSIKLDDYISFYFLRQYGFLNGKPITEKVFVHSKIIIIDDRVVISSSGNFNDRSFQGDRDSELGLVVQDELLIPSKMNGQFYFAAKFAKDLRIRLWKEHLNFSDDKIHLLEDPISKETYHDIWLKTAENNTKIFESVFPSIPRNIYNTWDSFVSNGGLILPALPIEDPEKWKQLKDIKGVLTLHPIGWLIDDPIDSFVAVIMGDEMYQ